MARFGSISVVNGFICVRPSKIYPVTAVVDVSFAITGLKDFGSEITSITKEPPYFGSPSLRTAGFSSFFCAQETALRIAAKRKSIMTPLNLSIYNPPSTYLSRSL